MSPSPLLGAVSSLIQCSHYSFSIQMDPFPVKFAATGLVCCLTLLGHTRKMKWTPERNRMSVHPNKMGLC
ncbi:hypothetical protein BRARA_A01503 [Brassica rapa]|uniref:Uncharacterized protein n=1 Tax=Brassica campestris TaxID=3711 RepID=A0A398ALW7_BRACM|nr:hypothetical protein BRARA_A01503 [Brassica rapa]